VPFKNPISDIQYEQVSKTVASWIELIEGIVWGDSSQRVIGLFFEKCVKLGETLFGEDPVNLCKRHGGLTDARTDRENLEARRSERSIKWFDDFLGQQENPRIFINFTCANTSTSNHPSDCT